MTGYNAMKGRKYLRAMCGFCDRDVAVNVTGYLRHHEHAHGDPCTGVLATLRAQTGVMIEFEDETSAPYNLCVVCGDMSEVQEDTAASDALIYRKVHNHRRPKVLPDGDRFAVTWYSYGKAEWRRSYQNTREKAMTYAANIRER